MPEHTFRFDGEPVDDEEGVGWHDIHPIPHLCVSAERGGNVEFYINNASGDNEPVLKLWDRRWDGDYPSGDGRVHGVYFRRGPQYDELKMIAKAAVESKDQTAFLALCEWIMEKGVEAGLPPLFVRRIEVLLNGIDEPCVYPQPEKASV